jgi:hypothetical protein
MTSVALSYLYFLQKKMVFFLLQGILLEQRNQAMIAVLDQTGQVAFVLLWLSVIFTLLLLAFLKSQSSLMFDDVIERIRLEVLSAKDPKKNISKNLALTFFNTIFCSFAVLKISLAFSYLLSSALFGLFIPENGMLFILFASVFFILAMGSTYFVAQIAFFATLELSLFRKRFLSLNKISSISKQSKFAIL